MRHQAGFVARECQPHFVQEALVDLVDDLQMPRQQASEQTDGPFLQGFGQQRVAGVSKRAARDVPGSVPVHVMHVHQQPHQFRNRHHRVRVVQLDHGLVRKLVPVAVLEAEAAENVIQRTGDEEVLLLEPQFPALRRTVVGIQHLADVFRVDLLLHGPSVVAYVEEPKIEFLAGAGSPQPQDIHFVGAVTGNQRDAGLAQHSLIGQPAFAKPPPSSV